MLASTRITCLPERAITTARLATVWEAPSPLFPEVNMTDRAPARSMAADRFSLPMR